MVARVLPGHPPCATPPTCPPRICAATACWLAVTSGWLVSRRRVCIGRCGNVMRDSTACLQCEIKRKSRRAQRRRFCKVGITRRPIAGRMLWGRGRGRRARAEGGESDSVAAMPLVAQLRVCDANLKADTAVRNATCLQYASNSVASRDRVSIGFSTERRARAEGEVSDGVAAMSLVLQLRVCSAH